MTKLWFCGFVVVDALYENISTCGLRDNNAAEGDNQSKVSL